MTPLTTYTYTAGSSSTDTVSATDEDRLLPGGLSLRYGFPMWFKRDSVVNPPSPTFRELDSQQERGRSLSLHDRADLAKSTHEGHHRKPMAFHIPPPKEDGFSADEVSPSLAEVLHYLKRVFEDETLLDDLPVEAAVNPGAWQAWQAHRRKTKTAKSHLDKIDHGRSPSTGLASPGRAKASSEWNWDGVWIERVKRGVAASLSDQMLFGSVDGDDVVREPRLLESERISLIELEDPLSRC